MYNKKDKEECTYLRTSNMNLRKWLFRHRMKIGELAELLQIDRGYIHRWMTGRRKPSIELLSRISQLTSGKVKDFEDLIDPPREEIQLPEGWGQVK